MNKSTISVLMPDTEGELGIKVLRCLSVVPHLKVFSLSREKWNSARLSRHHSGFFSHTVDTFDTRRLEVILEHTQRLKPDALLPIDQPTIRLLSEHRDVFRGLVALPPLPDLKSMEIAENKWRLTDVLEREGIPYPKTVHVNPQAWREIDFNALTYPVLTKPVEGAGGTGIQFFDTPQSLEAYFQQTTDPGDIIIQSFIRGYDLGCSVLCENGEVKAYTIQKGVIPGDKRFEPPSTVAFIQDEQVIRNVQKMMRALNWSGVANIDHRYDEDAKDAKILEINPRFWGSVLGSVVAGINFPYLMVQRALKQEIPAQSYRLFRYAKPEKTPKLLFKKYFRGDDTLRSITDSGLPYTLLDPGPELIKYFNKVVERFTDR